MQVVQSEQILNDYLSKGLVTHLMTASEFEKFLSNLEINLDREDISNTYNLLQERDHKICEEKLHRIQEFFQRTRRISRNEFEAIQLDETISMERLVNSLYAANQVFDEEISRLDSEIKVQNERSTSLVSFLHSNAEDKTTSFSFAQLTILLKKMKDIGQSVEEIS
ncbi:LAFE_0D02586g1_1 [Lachancea fermentati]|uniref:LAFE_0D02586g1_1 n=1 Tax=Lachancea fermentati TaxID=4955 RepID=A0A1G4MAW6_LACFM|nr:LAFE_0D02586g1_1 [Lachancea fermentati]